MYISTGHCIQLACQIDPWPFRIWSTFSQAKMVNFLWTHVFGWMEFLSNICCMVWFCITYLSWHWFLTKDVLNIFRPKKSSKLGHRSTKQRWLLCVKFFRKLASISLMRKLLLLWQYIWPCAGFSFLKPARWRRVKPIQAFLLFSNTYSAMLNSKDPSNAYFDRRLDSHESDTSISVSILICHFQVSVIACFI